MSERCERASERTSEWPSTYVPITSLSKPPCAGMRLPAKTSSFFLSVFASEQEGMSVRPSVACPVKDKTKVFSECD